MTIYVYADAETKEIATISSKQLSDMESFVEIEVADDHAVVVDKSRYQLNAANDDIGEIVESIDDKKNSRQERRDLLDAVFSYVLSFVSEKLLAGGSTEAEITALWQDFNYVESTPRIEYVETGHPKLLSDVAGDVPNHNEWLDLDIGGMSVREYIQAKLSGS